MPKLTLSVDRQVILRAKSYARTQGSSVSKLVESYLELITSPQARSEDPPVLRSLRGILRKADPRGYRRYLAKKYR